MAKLQNQIMRLAAVLLCLTLLSLYLLCGMYARYTSQDGGGDSARVAKFNVSESDSLQSYTYAVEIIPDTSEKLEVQITNFSETSVKYILEFLVEGNLPITITPDITNGAGNTLNQQNANAWIWETTKESNLNTTETYNFNLSLNNKSYMYSGGIERIILTLTAEQVD